MARVLVTGIGVVCGLGVGFEALADALHDGRSAIRKLDLAVGDWTLSASAVSVDDGALNGLLTKAERRDLDRTAQLAVVAADEAVRSSGLEGLASLNPAGVVIGTSVGSWDTLQTSFGRLYSSQTARLRPNTIPKIMPNSACSAISIRHGLTGPSFTVSTACSSSNHAIALGSLMIRSGQADIVLVGGADAPLTYSSLRAWSALRILAPDSCRPFSAERKGLVLGEGAAVFVLESEAHVARRKGRAVAEVLGWSMNADADDIVRPNLDSIHKAVTSALADGGVTPPDVDYINAHGTGTRVNDQVEATALKSIFSLPADRPRISSTKSLHGHCLGAAGAVEAAMTMAAMQHGIVPPTANFLGEDPECAIDVTPNVPVAQPIDIAVSCSFAFGGLNSVIVFRNLAR